MFIMVIKLKNLFRKRIEFSKTNICFSQSLFLDLLDYYHCPNNSVLDIFRILNIACWHGDSFSSYHYCHFA